MNKIKIDRPHPPVDQQLDPEVIAFRLNLVERCAGVRPGHRPCN
jgi:hypothetical protein